MCEDAPGGTRAGGHKKGLKGVSAGGAAEASKGKGDQSTGAAGPAGGGKGGKSAGAAVAPGADKGGSRNGKGAQQAVVAVAGKKRRGRTN